jgi:hypothetical protein
MPNDGSLRMNRSECQNQSYFTTGSLPLISSPWRQAPLHPRPEFLFSNWTIAVTVLTRGWVCILQLLLALTSAVILRSEFRRAHDHILPSQIRNSRNLEGQLPVFITPRNRVMNRSSLHGSLSSLSVTMENVCCLAVVTETWLTKRCLSMDFRVYLLLLERMFDEPLDGNWFPLWVHYSSFQASCHNII